MKFLKTFALVITFIAVFVFGAVFFFNASFPAVKPAESVSIELTKERIERGKYLANSVAVCIDCHSARDWRYFSGPPKKESIGMGGEVFDEEAGFPGRIIAKNITPAALSSWTDGEIIRAIRVGVDRNNHGLFPVMPYDYYGAMSQEDIYAIVAYLRTLEPINHDTPETKLNFPLNFLVNTFPKDRPYGVMPNRSTDAEYGKYVFTIAACGECHTPILKKDGTPQKDSSRYCAGGFEFPMKWGLLRSSNITSDKETGIGSWTREQFIGKFKNYASEANKQIVMTPPFDKTRYNSIMPWTMYADMTEDDLSAIFSYLQTLTPVSNKIECYSGEGATFISHNP